MRRTATAVPLLLLLLLLPSAWQDGEAARSQKSVILSEELKELRYIIYEQGTMLAETKTLLKDVIKENLGGTPLASPLVNPLPFGSSDALSYLHNFHRPYSAGVLDIRVSGGC